MATELDQATLPNLGIVSQGIHPKTHPLQSNNIKITLSKKGIQCSIKMAESSKQLYTEITAK